MKISYKKAWRMVNSTNTTAKGGKGGGGTRLTDYGRMMISKYEQLMEKAKKVMKVEEQQLSEEG